MLRLQTECAAVLCYTLKWAVKLDDRRPVVRPQNIWPKVSAVLGIGAARGQRPHCGPQRSLGEALEPSQTGFPPTSGIGLLTSLRGFSSGRSQGAAVHSIFRRLQELWKSISEICQTCNRSPLQQAFYLFIRAAQSRLTP